MGSQETPGVTGKFGLGIRNEAGQRLIEFCQENALVITAGVQPRLIQGIRSGDGVGEGKDTIASIRY